MVSQAEKLDGEWCKSSCLKSNVMGYEKVPEDTDRGLHSKRNF